MPYLGWSIVCREGECGYGFLMPMECIGSGCGLTVLSLLDLLFSITPRLAVMPAHHYYR